MKKEYRTPEVEFVEFGEDIVAASSGDWCYVIAGDNTDYCVQKSDWFEGFKKIFP